LGGVDTKDAIIQTCEERTTTRLSSDDFFLAKLKQTMYRRKTKQTGGSAQVFDLSSTETSL